MRPIPAMRVVTATGAQVLGHPPFGAFTSVSTDTRALGSGALFVALRGERFDGHSFLAQAEEAGALAAVVDAGGAAENASGLPVYIVPDTLKALQDLAAAYRRQFDVPLVAVTGTVGKTTTKDFVAAILSTVGDVVATRANDNNEIGVPQTLFRMDDDTAAAVVEMGMRGPGQIAELTRIAQPTHGILTGAGKTHAEFFPDGQQGVARAKAELLDEMEPGRPVALPADASWYRSLFQEKARGPVTSFGFEPEADVRAENYRLEDGGAAFRIVTPRGGQDVRLRLPGRHFAWNAAAAFCVAEWLEIPMSVAAEALGAVEPGAHRFQVHAAPAGYVVVDDCYNAGPDSMRAALEALADWPAARRFAILGDMRELGDDAEEEHRALGQLAAKTITALITVGDLARHTSESAAEAGLPVRHAETAESAAENFRPKLKEGDVVLVKGSRALALERAVEALLA